MENKPRVDGVSEELMRDVIYHAIKKGQYSLSEIQREFLIGFATASRITDVLEDMGYIGPSIGCDTPRKVIATEEKFISVYGENGKVQCERGDDMHKLKSDVANMEKILGKAVRGDVHITNHVTGDAFVRYDFELSDGADVKAAESCASEVTYELAAASIVRIYAPIPGAQMIRVEVPLDKRRIVRFGALADDEYFTSADGLPAIIGRDVAGNTVLCDLKKIPHLLIGGQTASGKTNLLNGIILSLMRKATPDELRFIFIDCASYCHEMEIYMFSPYMYYNRMFSRPYEACAVLEVAEKEMSERYKLMQRAGVNNVDTYNKQTSGKKLPHIVIVVENLDNIMMSQQKRVAEARISNIAAKARAAGIHLILATMRCTADIITGTIKANLVNRIALKVSDELASRVLIDTKDATFLMSKGDALYYPCDYTEAKRVQTAIVGDSEIDDAIEYAKRTYKADFYSTADVDAAAKCLEEKTHTAPGGDSGRYECTLPIRLNDRISKLPGYNKEDNTFTLDVKMAYPDGEPMVFEVFSNSRNSAYYIIENGYAFEYVRKTYGRVHLHKRLNALMEDGYVEDIDGCLGVKIELAANLERCVLELVRAVDFLMGDSDIVLRITNEMRDIGNRLLRCSERELVLKLLFYLFGGNSINASLVHRKFSVGFARASCAIDVLNEAGIVSLVDKQYKMTDKFTPELLRYIKYAIVNCRKN